jgi:PAS domain S-box-containing protein
VAAELNHLRLYHRRTLEELPLAACSVGEDKEIMLWNTAMEYLTGIESHSVTGSRLEEVLEPWGNLLHKFLVSDTAHFYKQEVELAGQPRWISLHKAAIPSSYAKKIDSQVILLEDVTELQILENELMHSERLASVGRLAAGVAHEIGNPVTGIACLAQNLKYETDDDEILETAKQILSQTHRVSRIVQSLVSFSHSGNVESKHFQTVNLWECAQEAINLIDLQKEKGERIYVNRIPRELTIDGDSQRIIQVFVNMVSNARDASPHGSKITIEGELKGNMVMFSVSDEGTGIPEEMHDRIFEPFFTTKEPGEGTGLGLAMAYNIIEDHHGTLDIISPVNIVLQLGTKFVMKMPVSIETGAV